MYTTHPHRVNEKCFAKLCDLVAHMEAMKEGHKNMCLKGLRFRGVAHLNLRTTASLAKILHFLVVYKYTVLSQPKTVMSYVYIILWKKSHELMSALYHAETVTSQRFMFFKWIGVMVKLCYSGDSGK
jgi:hypothetical protein